VNRCPKCKRGYPGYFDGEKTIHDLLPGEIITEIEKYKAKEERIRYYLKNLDQGIKPLDFSVGARCPECNHGWREFQEHRKDLEQLTKEEAISAPGANTHYLNDLISKHEANETEMLDPRRDGNYS
jgi:hypothetical protein